MEKNYTREKVVLVIYMGLYATCMMGLSLFIPLILTTIIQYQPQYYIILINLNAHSIYSSFYAVNIPT